MTMTARDMVTALGKFCLITFDKLTIVCEVMDAKHSYGALRVLVQPVAGVGSQWVDASRIRAIAAPPEGVRNRMQELLKLES